MTQGYVATWDGSASSGISGLILQRLNRYTFGAVRDATIALPGRDGEWLYPERRGNRTITAECVIVKPPPLRHAAVVELAEWLDRQGYLRLIFDDQPDRFWLAAVSTDPSIDEWRQLARFPISWTAQPYAFDLAVSTECVSASGGNGSGSFVIPDTVDAYPVVEVEALNGGTDALDTFTLTVNGEALSVLATVNQNEVITISSQNFSVFQGANTDLELTGAYVPGTVFPGRVFGEFPVLTEGNNTWEIQWDGAGTEVSVCFSWRRRYR